LSNFKQKFFLRIEQHFFFIGIVNKDILTSLVINYIWIF
jgi:hypothetical protein